MRKSLVTTTAMLLAFGAGAAQAHDPASMRADWLEERLELSEEQRARVDAIFAEAQEQREALRAQAREQRKAAMEQRREMRKQSQAIGESTRERLAEVLTEEQNARLADTRKRLERRAIMRDGRRGMRGGPGMERRKGMLRRMIRSRQMHEETKTEAPAAEDQGS